MIQSPPELLRDGLCPAMLMPSKACKWEARSSSPKLRAPKPHYELLGLYVVYCVKLKQVDVNGSSPPSTVTRRCLPALGTMKGGVVVVGNETTLDAGEGFNINATDVLEASKWVLFTVCTHAQTKYANIMRTLISLFVLYNSQYVFDRISALTILINNLSLYI